MKKYIGVSVLVVIIGIIISLLIMLCVRMDNKIADNLIRDLINKKEHSKEDKLAHIETLKSIVENDLRLEDICSRHGSELPALRVYLHKAGFSNLHFDNEHSKRLKSEILNMLKSETNTDFGDNYNNRKNH